MTLPTGPLTRAAPVRASSWNAEAWTFDLVLSAGAPVERGGYIEVLDVAGATWPDTIALLDSHRTGSLDDNLGEVGNIRREGNEIVGTARLSKHSLKAQRLAAELSDGHTFSGSIGYAVEKWAETKPAGKRTITAKSWRIREASLVSVPADESSKIRSLDLTTTTTTNTDTQTRAQINAEIRSIALATGAPADWANAQIDAEATLDVVRAAALTELTARSAAAGAIRNTATVGVDNTEPDAIRSAMSDALAHRLAPTKVKLEGRATEFRSHGLLDMVADMAIARGERINTRDKDALIERAVGAHSTSDFPLLLADAANKSLLTQYQVAAPTYRKWAARRTFNDFKAHSFLRVGDFPGFKEIKEGEEVKYGTISENGEKIYVREFTSGFAVTRRALINDDTGGLADFTAGIANRAAADENRWMYDLLAANANLSDNVALFHATHGNLNTASALSIASVGLAVAGLRKQKSLDGLVLNLAPAVLVVGPDSELTARQILAQITATKAGDINPWAGTMELVIDANIVGYGWYVTASPEAAPSFVYGYLAGEEGPQIRTEVEFDTRSVKVAAGLDFGYGALDYRGVQKNAGATPA